MESQPTIVRDKPDLVGTIRDRIIHLFYRPGDPLNEMKLAEEFQVSRTPIREALHRLASEGLVTIVTNLGARVSDINLRDFRELIELRIILERGAARLLARNTTEDDIRSMEQLNARATAAANHDLDALTDLDTQFHHIIQQATHNHLLIRQMSLVQVKFTWLMRLINYRPELMTVKLSEFIDAMRNRDADRLERLLVEHVEYFVEKMRQETINSF